MGFLFKNARKGRKLGWISEMGLFHSCSHLPFRVFYGHFGATTFGNYLPVGRPDHYSRGQRVSTGFSTLGHTGQIGTPSGFRLMPFALGTEFFTAAGAGFNR